MAQPIGRPARPERILLATDLSHRCDRALDRAADLARRWDAELVVIHALERPEDPLSEQRVQDLPFWLRPEDRVRKVERRLRRDLSAPDIRTSVVVEEAHPAALVLRTARDGASDLIVTGVARDGSFQKFLLGGTTDALIKDVSNPLLVVKARARQPYRQVLVPVDFTGPARLALETAAALLGDAELLVFHAADAPFSNFTDSTQYKKDMRQAAIRDCHAFLETSGLSPEIRARVRILVEAGPPDHLLASYLEDSDVDLVVLGTQGRSRLAEIMIGGTAKAILDAAPCDVLVVREPA